MGVSLVVIDLLLIVGITAPPQAEVYERVRSGNPRVVRAMEEGIARSPTFRHLIQRLQSGTVIIHIEAGMCACGARSCLTFVTSSGGVRYLRAIVNVRQPLNSLIAEIGHELRHALEIADAPDVTSLAAFVRLYEERADRSCFFRNCYETKEALATEAAVHRDLLSRTGNAGGR